MIRIILLFTLMLSWFCSAQSVQYGKFKLTYPNGLLQEEGIRAQNTSTGTQYWYDLNDNLIRKIDYSFSYPRAGKFEDYRHEEIIYDYNDNGDLTQTLKKINGETQAQDKEYYANGQIKFSRSNTSNGGYTRVVYFPNGRKKYRSSFWQRGKMFREHGTQTRWREDGTLITQAEFRDGLKVGERKAWNENGDLIEIFTYRNDTVVGIQRWTDSGLMTNFWSKDTSPETHFQLKFHRDNKTIQSKIYAKKYILDGEPLILNFTTAYDLDGKEDRITVRDANFRNNNRMYYGPQNIVSEKYITNYTFSYYIEHDYRGEKFLHLQPGANPKRMGFWIKNSVRLPIDGSKEEYRKIIKTKLNEVKTLIKKKKVNPSHQFNLENLPKAEAYYNKYLDEVVFKSARTITHFDTTMTGDYQILYDGTSMRFEGHLFEGLLHGTATLFLNDSIKLFERNYQYGVPHGEWHEWFLTGDIAMDLVFVRGREREHFYYYLEGGVAEHVATSELGNAIIDDEFDIDEKPRSLKWTEGDIYRDLKMDENGKVLSYRWYDSKREISISKRYYKGKESVSIHIPPVPGNIYTFDFSRNGIEINGTFWWDSVNKVNVLEDNIGTYKQLNKKEIAYSPNLPCDCKEWEKSDFFAPVTSQFIKKGKFKKYQLDFHAPISLAGIHGDPYYMSEAPKAYIPGKSYSLYRHFITRKAITFHLPDTSGLSFSLAPCRSKHAFVNQSVGVKFRVGHPNETNLTFSKLKTLELAFPSSMLRQVNESFDVLKDVDNRDMPGSFLFNATRVNYNKAKELDVIEPRYLCSRPMEIARTKLVLEAQALLPDVSRTENYPEMKQRWSLDSTNIDPRLVELGIDELMLNQFRGAFITRGQIHIPFSDEDDGYFPVEIEELAISSEYAIAILSLDYQILGETPHIINAQGKQQEVFISNLVSSIKALNGVKSIIENDDKNTTLTILMYIQK